MAGDELDQFVTEVLEAKKLSGISDEVRAQLLGDLKRELLDQINHALIDALPDDKLNHLNSLLEDESVSDDTIQQFMMDSGIDVKRITAETMLTFRGLYLQSEEEREV